MSYNSKELRMDRNRLSNFRQQMVQHFYRLTLVLKLQQEEEDKLPVVLEATGSLRVFVLTEDFD